VASGEMPIEHGDSWFSAKLIEVRSCIFLWFGKAISEINGESNK